MSESESPGMIADIKESLTHQEARMGDKSPGTPFVFVALTYIAVLALGCGLIAVMSWTV